MKYILLLKNTQVALSKVYWLPKGLLLGLRIRRQGQAELNFDTHIRLKAATTITFS